jgi:beta-glucosidase
MTMRSVVVLAASVAALIGCGSIPTPADHAQARPDAAADQPMQDVRDGKEGPVEVNRPDTAVDHPSDAAAEVRDAPAEAGKRDSATDRSAGLDGGQPPPRSVDWADERVRALVGQMTLAEKIGQLSHAAPSISRLGVAGYNYWSEGLHGVLTDGATSFPQAIAMASAWDPDLIERVASAIGDEARGFNATTRKGLTYWSPVINMLRDPRWGRYDESFTEDPFLMARMGVAFVRGLQGNDPKYLKAVATPKHYVANNSEYNRHTGSSDIDEQLLFEYYLPAFQAAVVEGGAFSVMSAYNRVNGVPASASSLLLQDLLRDTWGFQGYVVSDCGAVSDIVQGHHWTATAAEATAKSLLAGTDLNCGWTYPNELQDALDQGLIVENDIDRALERVLRARFLLGEFDPADEVPYRAIGADVIESPEHAALALAAARASIVLLKNDGILPLDQTALRSIAIIGPHGDDAYLGSYSGSPSRRVSAFAGIRAKLEAASNVTVAFEQGCSITGSKDDEAFAKAVDLARVSDVAIVVVGTSLEVMSEERDRPDWSLPGVQSELIEAVKAVNPRTVVVLVTGGPVAVDWAQENVPALLTGFYNGQEQGAALADVLCGDTNPAGKLTTTWYTGDATLPPIGDYDLRKGRTYLYYDGLPLYPFGHGLSYTTFAYSELRIEPRTLRPEETALVSVQIKNTGSRAGDEVVQLYVHDAFASVPRPLKELRGFLRVHLAPGESKTVRFPLAAKDLAFWDVTTHAWRVEDGLFDVAIGSSSADLRVQGSLSVASTAPTGG